VWVLGSTRLALPRQPPPRAGDAQLATATGGFLARVLPPAAAARALIGHFLRRAGRGDPGHPHEAAAGSASWQRLLEHPRLARADVLQLKGWHAAAQAGRRVPLARLQRLLVRLERQLR
jgi:hypothetical protein